MDKWWQSQNVVGQITNWSFELAERFPTERLISLGQSPAWVVYGAGMLRKMRGQKANTTLVPFTRCFFDIDKDREPKESSTISVKKNEHLYPSEERFSNYFKFLELLNMQPKQMHESISEGEQFVIAEMIRSAKGLASFIHSWLREMPENFPHSFGKEVSFYTYDVSPVSTRTGLNVPLKDCDAEIYIPFQPKPLDESEADIMENTASCNAAEPKTSRLMPLYQMAANRPCKGLEICPNGPIRREIKFALHTAIQKRQQSEKIYPSETVSSISLES
jgi:hypothetical protein